VQSCCARFDSGEKRDPSAAPTSENATDRNCVWKKVDGDPMCVRRAAEVSRTSVVDDADRISM
jgi:hypothetical protein